MRGAICVLVLIAGVAGPAFSQQAQPAAVPVGTVSAERKAIAKTLDFVGRVEAINRVEIRARVTGFLEAVLFKEGDLVKEGAALYRIEKGPVRGRGGPGAGRARAQQGGEGPQRAPAAARGGTVGQTVRARWSPATRRAPPTSSPTGAVMQDEANLQTAKINLGYTDIVAPIAGKIGRTNVTKGNVVGPDKRRADHDRQPGPDVRDLSGQPARVPARQRGRATAPKSRASRSGIRFADGSTYDQIGAINFVDVTVDRATDTVIARATMPNPKGALIDGQLVRVAARERQARRKRSSSRRRR